MVTGARGGTTLRSSRGSQGVSSGRATGERSSAQERFDRRVHARRRRTWKVLAAVLVLGLALGGVWWVLWRSDWLIVKRVVVAGVEPRWESAVLAAASIAQPQPMVEVDTDAAAAAVGEIPVAKEVQVHRSWPSTITIEVTARQPVLAVRQGSGFALVDDEGVSVEVVAQAPPGVPTLATQGRDGATEAAYRAAWAVLSTLPETLTTQVTAATVSSADLLTLDLAGRTVVWGGPEDSELKVQVVEALLAAGQGYIDVSAPRTPVTRP